MLRGTPVYDMVRRYKSRLRFHVPGHKGRQKVLGRAAALDITELAFSDDLARPRGALKEAEELLAGAYGARRAFFTTDGATSGVLAALAVFAGKTVLLDRYSHKSAYAALELFQIRPVFFRDRVSLFPDPPDAAEIERALSGNPEIAAVFLTTPDYYGRSADTAAVSRAAKRRNAALIVDASHGSHYAFSKLLPPCPTRLADIAVLSLHKTGIAATQAAAVLVNDEEFEEGVRQALARLRTSSPSYLILSTIDFSRAFMVQCYGKQAKRQAEAVRNMRRRLAGTKLDLLKSADFTRLVVDVAALGISGFQAERALNARGVYPEAADFTRVVFVLSAPDSPGKIRALTRALLNLAKLRLDGEPAPVFPEQAPERVLPYLERARSERIPLQESAGRISAVNAGLYPPAVPVLLKGERISRETAELLVAAGDALYGADEEIEVYV